MSGFERNSMIFSGRRRFRCGEKLARLRDGCGRRTFFPFADAVLMCLAFQSVQNYVNGSSLLQLHA